MWRRGTPRNPPLLLIARRSVLARPALIEERNDRLCHRVQGSSTSRGVGDQAVPRCSRALPPGISYPARRRDLASWVQLGRFGRPVQLDFELQRLPGKAVAPSQSLRIDGQADVKRRTIAVIAQGSSGYPLLVSNVAEDEDETHAGGKGNGAHDSYDLRGELRLCTTPTGVIAAGGRDPYFDS